MTPITPQSRTPRTPNRRYMGTRATPARAGERRIAGGGTSARPRRSQARRPRTMTNPPLPHRDTVANPDIAVIPPLADPDTVRVIPVGGVEEVGKNMLLVETADDIIIFDAGFQFVSEENDAPGINYILPNTQYLEENRHKIRGLIITHGHLDHIGGIPFLIERIGNPPIYTRYLTSLMILKRQEEFPHLPKVNMNVIELDTRIKVGNTYIKAF